MDNILSITGINPREVSIDLASRVKARRLEMNLTQEGLALRADVALPTYRRFERTGEISLSGLLRIAFALDCLQDFNMLFSQEKYQSIEDVLAGNNRRKRERGHINE